MNTTGRRGTTAEVVLPDGSTRTLGTGTSRGIRSNVPAERPCVVHADIVVVGLSGSSARLGRASVATRLMRRGRWPVVVVP